MCATSYALLVLGSLERFRRVLKLDWGNANEYLPRLYSRVTSTTHELRTDYKVPSMTCAASYALLVLGSHIASSRISKGFGIGGMLMRSSSVLTGAICRSFSIGAVGMSIGLLSPYKHIAKRMLRTSAA
jgi:hypothetical protein